MLSGILSDICSAILSDSLLGVCSGMLSGIYSVRAVWHSV